MCESSKEHIPVLTQVLKEMHFDRHILDIKEHYDAMKEKARGNLNYKDAVVAAETLLNTCVQAKIALYQHDADINVKILAFKNTCKSAIKQAKPVLKKHRDFSKVLDAFLMVIMAPFVVLPLYLLGYFSIKTKSAQLVDKFQDDIDKPGPRNA